MDPRMQDYWKQKREGLILEIESLEKATERAPVSDRQWKKLDRRAHKLLMKWQQQTAFDAWRNVLKMWRKLTWRTPSFAWSMQKAIRSKLRARLLYCASANAGPEQSLMVYEAGLKGENRQRTIWVNGLKRDRLSESGLFLDVIFNTDGGVVMCWVYPEIGVMPASVFINRELGLGLKGDTPLNEMVPNLFLNNRRTALQVGQAFVEMAQREDRHRKMVYKLERLKEELQRFDRNQEKWDKIYLPAEQKIDLIKQMDMFLYGGSSRPQALLLKGGPGTGKTLLAKTMADVAGSKFYRLSIADIKHPNIGESGQRVAKIWKEARANKPAILFLDECEGLFGQRGAVETDIIGTDIVQAFLAQWDGKEDGVWVMGATNRRDMIDRAILSRFGTEMEIGLPDEESRRLILEQELSQNGTAVHVSAEVARETQGFSGRDIAMLAGKIRTAAHPGRPTQEIMLRAIRKQRVNGNAGIDSEATWGSLILAPETMTDIQTLCSMLKDVAGWKANGVTIPAGVLLSGPPGTGKTQIARTMANESGLGFISASTADIKAGFIGQSGQKVKQLFERARAASPAILFIDEIDIVSTDRGSGNDYFQAEIIGQILQEIDGIHKSTADVFVLAATNRPDSVDKAILSRFTRQISVPLPDRESRGKILEVLLRSKRTNFDLMEVCQSLATMSEGQSGRDLKNWVVRAEQKAVQRAVSKGGPAHFQLTRDDFTVV